jgi:F0F1-type ATP synthase epsilon subunit
VLQGRELFSDAPHDEAWLRLLFDAAGFDTTLMVRRTDARILISQAAADSELDEAAYERAKAQATELAPRRHRAEADARHLAVLWNIVTRERF